MNILKSRWLHALVMVAIVLTLAWTHTVYKRVDTNVLSRQVEQIREHMQDGEWTEASDAVSRLEQMYENKRWLLELLEPTEHANEVRLQIATLVEAVRLEDEKESKQLAAKIKASLDSFIIF